MSRPELTPRTQRAPVRRDECPLATAATLFGERWNLLILRELFYGVDRFDDICADLGISRSTLTSRLRTLSDHGLIERTSYRQPGERKRSRYVLTAAANDLTITFWALTKWSEEHLHGSAAPAQLVRATDGANLTVRLAVDEDEQALVTPEQTTWRLDLDDLPRVREPSEPTESV